MNENSNFEFMDIIFDVIDEINETLPKDGQLAKSPDTPVAAFGSSLDSLGIVNFILLTEEKLQEKLDSSITLFDESLLGKPEGPFSTVANLCQFAQSRVRNHSHAHST
ncbi:MAG: hypothetical protein AB8G05_16770 [Oligoflexales bacterium]